MVLGIDLGTCNTVAATLSRDGTPVVIPDAGNKDLLFTPTKLLLHQNRAYVGQVAEYLFELYPEKKLLSFFKRQFGTGLPVYQDGHHEPWFSEGLAALVLKKIIHDAEAFQPDGFSKSVITVPAHYNDVQRKSVYEAARLAGLDLSMIIDEPVAAALNYGLDHVAGQQELTLVYDFGGGTFDLTLITQTDHQLHVIAKEGIEKLGGKEFDNLIASQIIAAYSDIFKGNFPEDPLTQNRLQKLSEEIKIQLNTTDSAVVSKWMLFGKNAMQLKLPVKNYQHNAVSLIEQTNQVVNRCLRSMGLQLKDIHNLLLVGGTSSSKFLHQYWMEKLQGSSTKVIYHQPLNSVAKGAAIYARSLFDESAASYRSIELKSVSTYNIGLIQSGSKTLDVLIHRNSPLPATAQKHFQIKAANSNGFSFEICQYWDESEKQVLGKVILDDTSSRNDDFLLEVQIENKANGTIGLKLRNAHTQRDVAFSFTRNVIGVQYNYQQQKMLVDQMVINNIF